MRNEHAMRKTAHESKLNQLNEMEARMIGELQKTLQKKQAAVDNLQSKSPALKKQMEPRQAYQYRKKDESDEFGQTQSHFGTHMTQD